MDKLDPVPLTEQSVQVNERLETLSFEEWLKEIEINISSQMFEKLRVKYKKTEQDGGRGRF